MSVQIDSTEAAAPAPTAADAPAPVVPTQSRPGGRHRSGGRRALRLSGLLQPARHARRSTAA